MNAYRTGLERQKLVWVLVILAIAGCAEATPNGSKSYPVQRALIGKSKAELLVCAGQPLTERVKGEQVLFVYYREASQLEESFAGSKSSFPMVHHGCRATLLLEEERVTGVQYESVPSTYRDDDHCEEIFQSCVSP